MNVLMVLIHSINFFFERISSLYYTLSFRLFVLLQSLNHCILLFLCLSVMIYTYSILFSFRSACFNHHLGVDCFHVILAVYVLCSENSQFSLFDFFIKNSKYFLELSLIYLLNQFY